MVDRRALSIYKAASTEPHRPALNTLRVREDGHLEATNGHILVRVPLVPLSPEECPEGWTNPEDDMAGVLIDAKQAQELMKRLPKSRTLPILNCASLGREEGNNGQAVASFDLDVQKQTLRLVEESYPNTDRVWPKDKEGDKPPKFQVRLAAKYLRMIADFAEGKDGEVILSFDGKQHSPMRFECADEDRTRPIRGVLMPMRL